MLVEHSELSMNQKRRDLKPGNSYRKKLFSRKKKRSGLDHAEAISRQKGPEAKKKGRSFERGDPASFPQQKNPVGRCKIAPQSKKERVEPGAGRAGKKIGDGAGAVLRGRKRGERSEKGSSVVNHST